MRTDQTATGATHWNDDSTGHPTVLGGVSDPSRARATAVHVVIVG